MERKKTVEETLQSFVNELVNMQNRLTPRGWSLFLIDEWTRWKEKVRMYLEQVASTQEADRFWDKVLSRPKRDDELAVAEGYLRGLIDKSIRKPWAVLQEVPKAQGTGTKARRPGKRIFVVHGRDQGMKHEVARFLEKLEHKPVILHEQPSKGRTIIEKFEDYSDVAYAIVLLTADDVGKLASEKTEPRPRARQNVVFELGFFIAKLGRERVCALYQEGLELPSDYKGVVYVPLDPRGAWKLSLGKELKAAGLEVDLDKAV